MQQFRSCSSLVRKQVQSNLLLRYARLSVRRKQLARYLRRLALLAWNGLQRLPLSAKQDQKNQHVRHQQQRHQKSGNVKGRAQLSRQQSDLISLIEGEEQISRAPDVENPGEQDAQSARQRPERKQSENGGDNVAHGSRHGERRRQVRRHNAWYHERQPDEAEAMQDEQRPKRLRARPSAQVRPHVLHGDNGPGDEAESDARTKQDLRRHRKLLRWMRVASLYQAGSRVADGRACEHRTHVFGEMEGQIETVR